MLWACIVFPQLALDCVLRRQEDPERPLALVGGTVQRRVLMAVNRAAWQQGLRSGQRLTMARAISDDFRIVLHDPEESRQWQQQWLASWAYGYSTQVHTGYPQALLLEVGASLRLMGGWPAFEARLRRDLCALQFRHRIAVAPTPRAAHVLAWWQDGLCIGVHGTPPHGSAPHAPPAVPPRIHASPPAITLLSVLESLPVRQAFLPDDAGEQLQRMGIRRLQHLFSLPRDGLQRRFGDALLLHLDQLRGLVPEALDFFQPPDRFDLRLELPHAVDSHQSLLFPVRRLLLDLVAFLSCRDRGVQHFCIHLEHETLRQLPAAASARDTRTGTHGRAGTPPAGTSTRTSNCASTRTGTGTPASSPQPAGKTSPHTRIEIGLLSAERDPALLVELVRTRFEQLHLASPVVAVRLVAEHLPAFVPTASDLFDERPEGALPWPQLCERLRARLGDTVLHQLRVVADPRPERAWRRHLPGADTSPARRITPHGARHDEHDTRIPRPAWLLPAPLPLREPVAHILCGPERVESGWWDEHDVRRDYYVLETVKGQHVWAFSAPGQRGPWMLHGWF